MLASQHVATQLKVPIKGLETGTRGFLAVLAVCI